MRHVTFLVIAASLVVCVPASRMVHADLTDEQEKEARALIARLSAEEFGARQQAVEKLIAMGPDVFPLVRETAAATKDAEVKLRCDAILAGIERAGNVSVEEVPFEKPPRPEPSRITLDVKDEPIEKIVERFAEQSGNRPFVLAKGVEARTLTLKLQDVPYWDAVKVLCEAARLVPYSTAIGPDARLGLRPRQEKDRSWTSAGPMMVCVDLQRHDPAAVQSCAASIFVVWEDRLRLSAVRPAITGLIAPDGVDILAPPEDGQLPELDYGEQRIGSGGFPFFGVRLRLSRPERELQLTIEGTLSAQLALSQKRLTVRDVFGGGPKEVSADGLSLTVTDTRMEGRYAFITVETASDGKLGVTFTGTHAGMLELVDPQGGLHRIRGMGGTIGGAEPGAKPATEKTSVELVFRDLPSIPGKWSLTFTYPTERKAIEEPFAIPAVSLPPPAQEETRPPTPPARPPKKP